MTTPLVTPPLLDAPLLDAEPPPAAVAAHHSPREARSWWREPLLHFVVLGGLLFGLDRWLTKSDDRHTIVVSAEVDSEAVETFRAARGREPSAEELKALHQAWLDNEVLYREGLALQVDKGDPVIRERVIFKALSVVDSNVTLPHADDAVLRSWFEQHREKYDEPTRFDFEEAALSGDASEPLVSDFVRELNGGTPGGAKAGLRIFKNRPHQQLVDSYGADFARALETSTVGTWRALQTQDGWRAMKLSQVTPPRPADFEKLRGVVLQDWKDSVAAERRTAAVRALTKKYTVEYEQRVEGAGE